MGDIRGITLQNGNGLLPSQRHDAKESQILLWIWNCLQEINFCDYDWFIRDGQVLSRLVNEIKPGSVPEEPEPQNIRGMQRIRWRKKRIEKLLSALESYGVPRKYLFKPEDLLFMVHLPRVTKCIFEFGKIVDAKKQFSGPSIGVEPYDPINAKSHRRAGCLPIGDDILVSHVSIKKVTDYLLTPAPSDGKKKVSVYGFF